MLLQYLIENLTTNEVIGTTNVEIGKVEYDSKKIEKKDVFVAVKGYEKDGNDYIDEAIGNGAICVIVENNIDTSKYLDVLNIYLKLKKVNMGNCTFSIKLLKPALKYALTLIYCKILDYASSQVAFNRIK